MWLDISSIEALPSFLVLTRLGLIITPLLGQTPIPGTGESGNTTDAVSSSPQIEGSLQLAQQEAQRIGEAWDQHWTYALNGPLYAAMSYAGIICAVGTLLFFMMQWAKDLNEGNLSRPLSELIWPILVAILLTPSPFNVNVSLLNGDASYGWNGLARVTQQVRSLFSRAEVMILNVPGLLPVDINFQSGGLSAPTTRSAFQDANAITSAQAMIQSYISKCFEASGQAQMQCLEGSINASIDLLRAYQKVYKRPIKWMADRQKELEELNGKLADMYQQKPVYTNSGQISDSSGTNSGSIEGKQLLPSDFPIWMVGDPKSEIRQLLQGGAMGFRQMLEIAFLGTALVGPIALGCSLLPVPIANKTIATWFSGFCAIGFTKITYAIIVGIASSVLIQSAPVDTTWFYTFLTFLAPLIAVGLATGGGLALNGALNQAASPLIR